jgi:hypothetical protein
MRRKKSEDYLVPDQRIPHMKVGSTKASHQCVLIGQ